MKALFTSTAGRIGLGLALAAISAGLLVLAFPPFNLWFLVWFSFAPVIVAQYRIMPAKFSMVAPAVFNGLFLWGYLGPVFGGSGTFMEYLPVFAFVLSLLTDGTLRHFHEKTHFRWFVWQGVAAWMGIEMIRIFIPFAGTWGFVAYTLHTQPWLIQPASIFGIFGVSALILLLNYALGLAAIRAFDARWTLDADAPVVTSLLTRRWLIGAGATLVVWVALSLALFPAASGPTVRVAAIQPETSPGILGFTGEDARLAQLHTRMVEQTREAAAQGAQVIIWPEGSLQYDPQLEDPLGLPALARETGAYLVIGYMFNTDEGFRNEATVISPEGEFLGIFGKDHPVTFAGETSITQGTYPVYETPLGVLGTIICYDLDFTDTARKLARQGAQLIAVPSNDWAGIADKHYTHVVFRAVENRTAMVKADGGFDSAIIDPYGRVISLAMFPEGGEATLVDEVPLGRANALAVQLGDWFGWLCLAGMVFFIFGEKQLIKRAAA